MPAGWAITALIYAARRSTALRPSMISFVSRIAASMERSSSLLVGDARSVRVRKLHAPRLGEFHDLVARAVHDDDLDAQRAEDGEVEQDVREVRRGGDFAVHGNDEYALAKTRHVLQDFPEIRDVHNVGVCGGE